MSHVVDRLQASIDAENVRRAAENAERQSQDEAQRGKGHAAGREWAENRAEGYDLRTMAASTTKGDTRNHGSVAASAMGVPEGSLSPMFLQGFVQGALKVWGEVKDQLKF